MIDEVIKFLRDRLNTALPRDASEAAAEDLFVYVGTGKDDAVSFTSNAVSVLLIRIEEDTSLRKPDPYVRVGSNGERQRAEPDIRMNLHVLFVARFPEDYGRSLHHLSRLVRYFQNHRLFNRENSPDLDPKISQLVLELVTPSFSEQNEIWGALRAPYLPSALYKVRMIVFEDEEARPITVVKELRQTVVQAPLSS